MKCPDFYIIGASKCGTTALSDYLCRHPAICFARNKEPHFFSDDRPAQKVDLDFAQYWRRNFSYYDPKKHKAIGEGSGTYYISDVAVPNILRVRPDAKFIYMVRNPIEMAHSWYCDLRFSNSENVSFEEGWYLQSDRENGLRLPPQCPDPHILQYRRLAALGERLDILKRQIPLGQLLVVVTDDLARNPKEVYEAVLAFIEVPSDGRQHFPAVNTAKAQRNRLLGWLSASIPEWVHETTREFKAWTGLKNVQLNFLAILNARSIKRPRLASDFRKALLVEFEPEIRRLEQSLQRDFSAWRT
jgi:hypothetical protein